MTPPDGHVRYPGRSNAEVADSVPKGARPFWEKYWSASQKDIVQACWAPEPSARPTFKRICQLLVDVDTNDENGYIMFS